MRLRYANRRATRCALSDPAEHIPFAKRMSVMRERRATGLHAPLLGHPLGHDAAAVKQFCDIK